LYYSKSNRPLESYGGSAFLNAPTGRYLDVSTSSLLAPFVNSNGIVGKDGAEIWISFLVRATKLDRIEAGIYFGSSFKFAFTNGMTHLAPAVPLLLNTDYLVIEHLRFGTNGTDVREEYFNPFPGLASPVGAQGTNIISGNMRFAPGIALYGSAQPASAAMIDELRIGESYADVAPLRPVLLTNVVYSGGQMSFDFQSLTGLTHTVETRNDVRTGGWTNYAPFPGDGNLIHITVPTTNSLSRFFRVRTE